MKGKFKCGLVVTIVAALLFNLGAGLAWADGGVRVELTASDGYRLAGLLSTPQGKPLGGVVLLHMYSNNKESWQPLTEHLVKRGFVCLAIDMRGHGESRIGPTGDDNLAKVFARDPAFFNDMHLDGEAAVRYLAGLSKDKPCPIAIVGASVGCSVAIHTAVAGNVDIAAVAVMTPGRNYLNIPTMEHLKRWPGIPMLVLSSQEEVALGAEEIFKVLGPTNADLQVFSENNIHGTFMFGKVDGVEELITSWLVEKIASQAGRR